MEFSWTSFFLELINFLALIWILKFFFYKPVRQAIDKRQQGVQDTLNSAKEHYDEAKKLQQTYENRLHIWEQEKEEQRKKMEQALLVWKTKQQEQFKRNLDKEKEKIQAQQVQTLSSLINKNAKEALKNASAFSAKFLSTFADKHLEKKCIQLIINQLSELSTEKTTLLQNALLENKTIHIKSAYPIETEEKNELTKVLQKMLEREVSALFTQEPQLLAGLEIKIGSFFLKANLRDELIFFAETENE